MAQNLIIYHTEYGDLDYSPSISGKIELHEINKEVSILKIYVQELTIRNKPKDFYFEGSTEVMLTNYPIKIKNLKELDGKEIHIKNGWTRDESFTMLSIHDGLPINQNKIHFELNADESFTIKWEGFYGENTYDTKYFKLNITAHEHLGIITPLCMYDQEIISILEKENK